jgi:hypothetical protein
MLLREFEIAAGLDYQQHQMDINVQRPSELVCLGLLFFFAFHNLTWSNLSNPTFACSADTQIDELPQAANPIVGVSLSLGVNWY